MGSSFVWLYETGSGVVAIHRLEVKDKMKQEYFVYILRSVSHPEKTYVGFTERLDERMREHNNGSQIYSRRYAPWKRVTYVVFSERKLALAFEKYLKTPSGKAFIKKHLV